MNIYKDISNNFWIEFGSTFDALLTLGWLDQKLSATVQSSLKSNLARLNSWTRVLCMAQDF